VTAHKNTDYYIRFRYKITPFPLSTIKARLTVNADKIRRKRQPCPCHVSGVEARPRTMAVKFSVMKHPCT